MTLTQQLGPGGTDSTDGLGGSSDNMFSDKFTGDYYNFVWRHMHSHTYIHTYTYKATAINTDNNKTANDNVYVPCTANDAY